MKLTRAEREAIARGVADGSIKPGARITRARRNPEPDDMDQRYTDFHWGRRPKKKRRRRMPVPGKVYELGKLVAVTYETTKGREHAHWEHAFEGERPTLNADKEGNLVILGGTYGVTPRGIVG